MIRRGVMVAAVALALTMFCVSVYNFPSSIGVLLGASTAFVVLLLGKALAWLIDYLSSRRPTDARDGSS